MIERCADNIKKIEMASYNKIKKIQKDRFASEFIHAKKSKFYKRKLKGYNDVDLNNIEMLPFTYKKDLQNNHPFDFLAVPHKEVRLIFRSSGTTGNPTYSFHTLSDVEIIEEEAIRAISRIDINKSDIAMINAPFEMGMPGYAMSLMSFYAGAMTIRSGIFSLSPKEQLHMANNLKITTYFGYITGLLRMLEESYPNNKNICPLPLRRIVVGAEPLTDARRFQLSRFTNAKIYDSYGISEIGAPLGCECIFADGLHLVTDHVFLEIIDPITKERSKNNEGIIVLTTLSKEANPLIRYWTNDYGIITYTTCRCGRMLPRLRIKDKLDYMVQVEGKWISASDFEKYLFANEFSGLEYIVKIKKINGRSAFEILLEIIKIPKSSEIYEIESKIENDFGLKTKLVLKEKLTIKRGFPKRQRLINDAAYKIG